MYCLVGCIAMLAPRFAIVLVVIFSDFIGRAYDTLLCPLLGFLFMPTTTLAYAWAINTRGNLQGVQLIVFVLAVLIDLGMVGGSASVGRERD